MGGGKGDNDRTFHVRGGVIESGTAVSSVNPEMYHGAQTLKMVRIGLFIARALC